MSTNQPEAVIFTKKMKARVRFAPSPTGPLHIGGLRTALFNYLYTKKKGGVFILRTEDTDQNRYIKGSESYIQEALEWCGMIPDEGPENGGEFGPYRQSERKHIYKQYVQKLIDNQKAYYAFDSSGSLAGERKKAELEGQTFKYSALNRMSFKNSLTLNKMELEEGLKGDYVIRLKVEPGKTVSVFDELRGNVSVETDEIDDKILIKSDGMPTYHFANVVDDYLMKITCVIRGEEWLPSLPLHQLIYDAFVWKSPKFIHLPLILKPSGKGKLSKRDADKEGFPVFPLNWADGSVGFREMGFIAEGMINYLALLGWNSGTENEIYSLKELIDTFELSGVQKGGANFDYEKARWINHHQLVLKESTDLLKLKRIEEQLSSFSKDRHQSIIELVKERLYTLNDLSTEIAFIENTYPYDEKVIGKIIEKDPIKVLKKICQVVSDKNQPTDIKPTLMMWAKENEISVGMLMQTFRIALVGKLTGPDLFKIYNILEKKVVLKRIDDTINYINKKYIL